MYGCNQSSEEVVGKMKILQILSMYHPDGERVLLDNADVIRTDSIDPKHIISLLPGIDGIVLRAPAKITAEIIDAASSVKVISGAGVGLDNIDVTYATKKEIAVLHAPKVNTVSTAEHAVGLMFALSKQIIPFHKEMEKGNFSYRDQLFPYELRGKHLGIIGWGAIAQEVAKICTFGLGMKVVSYVRSIDKVKEQKAKELGVELTMKIEDIFVHSDIVSIHIPLTSDNSGFIDMKLLSLMKKRAYLINTARGAVVNETDLFQALSENMIAGAGLDVFAQEPPNQKHPLFALDNVVLSPHIGGITEESARESATIVAQNTIHMLQGKTPKHIANPEVLSKNLFK